jgi:hypothetical protein
MHLAFNNANANDKKLSMLWFFGCLMPYTSAGGYLHCKCGLPNTNPKNIALLYFLFLYFRIYFCVVTNWQIGSLGCFFS